MPCRLPMRPCARLLRFSVRRLMWPLSARAEPGSVHASARTLGGRLNVRLGMYNPWLHARNHRWQLRSQQQSQRTWQHRIQNLTLLWLLNRRFHRRNYLPPIRMQKSPFITPTVRREARTVASVSGSNSARRVNDLPVMAFAILNIIATFAKYHQLDSV